MSPVSQNPLHRRGIRTKKPTQPTGGRLPTSCPLTPTINPCQLMKKLILPLLLTVTSFAGCAKDTRPKDFPPLFPCAITITQDGKPLEGATVNLVPMEGTDSKYQASATTGADGKAVIKTYGYDGTPAGKFKVCVWKTLTESGGKTTDGYGEEIDAPGIEYRTVEEIYSDAKTTPHEIEVVGKDTAPVSFDVGKSVKIKKN